QVERPGMAGRHGQPADESFHAPLAVEGQPDDDVGIGQRAERTQAVAKLGRTMALEPSTGNPLQLLAMLSHHVWTAPEDESHAGLLITVQRVPQVRPLLATE